MQCSATAGAALKETGSQTGGRKKDPRKSTRMATNLPAFIKAEGWHSPVACHVTDFSSGGARVKFGDLDRLSSRQSSTLSDNGRLTLLIRLERIEAECRMVWRNSTELGLAFLSAPRLLGR